MNLTSRKFILFLILGTLTPALFACSSAQKKKSSADTPAVESSPSDLQSVVDDLKKEMTRYQSRMESLEANLQAMNEKVNATQNSWKNFLQTRKSTLSSSSGKKPVPIPAANLGGSPLSASMSKNDPEAGFTQDDAIVEFRQAKILFDTEKYSEAILAFSNFLKKYADHPLAGGAQYMIAESYHAQNELKLAAEEYQRVLVSYDRSSYVPQALKNLAIIYESLGNAQEASKNRQLLFSLFPQSPAAKSMLQAQMMEKKMDGSKKYEKKSAAMKKAPKKEMMMDPPPTAPMSVGDIEN